MNTPLTILLILVVIGGIVALLDHLPTRTETHSIGVRGLPGTAAASTDPDERATSPGGRS
jgi:hypothetical protein